MASFELPSYVPKTESINVVDVRFSQNSINNKFSSALGNEYIGKVVDKIYDGDTNLLGRILDNMAIGRVGLSATKQATLEGSTSEPSKDLWYTVNNRSLWVLKQLQSLGKLDQILNVNVDPNGIDKKRFTTRNRGSCVEVRTKPVGGEKSLLASFWRYKQDGAGVSADRADSIRREAMVPVLRYGGIIKFQSGGMRDDRVSVEYQSRDTTNTMTDKGLLDALKSFKVTSTEPYIPCMGPPLSDHRESKDGMSKKITYYELVGATEEVEDDGYDSDEYYF